MRLTKMETERDWLRPAQMQTDKDGDLPRWTRIKMETDRDRDRPPNETEKETDRDGDRQRWRPTETEK